MLNEIENWVLIKLINQDIIIYDAHLSVRVGILYSNVVNTAVMQFNIHIVFIVLFILEESIKTKKLVSVFKYT